MNDRPSIVSLGQKEWTLYYNVNKRKEEINLLIGKSQHKFEEWIEHRRKRGRLYQSHQDTAILDGLGVLEPAYVFLIGEMERIKWSLCPVKYTAFKKRIRTHDEHKKTSIWVCSMIWKFYNKIVPKIVSFPYLLSVWLSSYSYFFFFSF